MPRIRLQIIHLNLNDRGRSISSTAGGGATGEALKQFNPKPIVLKRLHKLQSFDHFLKDSRNNRASSGLHQDLCSSSTPSYTHPQNENVGESESVSDSNISDCISDGNLSDCISDGKDTKIPQEDEEESVFVFYVRGLNSAIKGDKDQILGTIVQLLNRHAVSVATTEHNLLCRPTSSAKSTLKHICLQTGMLAMSELLDGGMLDVSSNCMMGAAQCLTFTLYFNKRLTVIGRNIWNSRITQFLSDSWMSFGCVAVVAISASRQ